MSKVQLQSLSLKPFLQIIAVIVKEHQLTDISSDSFTSYFSCHLLPERYFVYQTSLYSENQILESIISAIFNHDHMAFLFQCSSEADNTEKNCIGTLKTRWVLNF